MNLFSRRKVRISIAACALGAALTACDSNGSSEEPAAPSTSAPSLGDLGTNYRDATCASIRPEVVNLTADVTEPSQKIIAIYKPKQLANVIADYYAGDYEVPAGQNRGRILSCVGQIAYADNGPDIKQKYGLEVDSEDSLFFVVDPA